MPHYHHGCVTFSISWHPWQVSQSQLSHWNSNGSCKEWHPGPSDSSTRALDKHHLLVIYSHPCGVVVATFEAARIFCCLLIVYPDPTGHVVTVGLPLLVWYASILFSGFGFWCLEGLVGLGPASTPVCGPFALQALGGLGLVVAAHRAVMDTPTHSAQIACGSTILSRHHSPS